ncbi:MAG: HAMP domain-containing sensor histidine kinase [Chryseolinea sp.]
MFRIALMVVSILLLIVLQCFWLLSSYENALSSFKRETSILFRTTVFDMRDSLFTKNIRTLTNSQPRDLDSTSSEVATVNRFFRDTLMVNDSLAPRQSKIQVFVNSTESTSSHLTPLISAIHRFRGRTNFVVSMRADTLELDSIAIRYRAAINRSGMDMPFSVKRQIVEPIELNARRSPFHEEVRKEEVHSEWVFRDTLVAEGAGINPIERYLAIFPGIRTIILKKIQPQIFFSLFLTLITSTAFLIMYRNIRAQQRLMNMKNDFISNITHELKTPLATVSVALEALRDFHVLEDPEKTKDYLNIAHNELNRLTLMTDRILNASVLESKGPVVLVEPLKLAQIFNHVLSSMRLVFEKKRLTVNFRPCDGHDDFEGSETQIANVIFNLLDNAIKYGLDRSTIDISLTCSPHTVGFEIKDEGPGIAKEYHGKIFEKFFRVPGGNVHNTKGHGLGLNYVAEVIKKHHGTINVESTLGNGSCFTVELPKKHGKH